MNDKNVFDYLNNGSLNYKIRQKGEIKEKRIQIAIDGYLTDENEQDFQYNQIYSQIISTILFVGF